MNKSFYYKLVTTFISNTIKDFNTSIGISTNIKFLTLQDDEINECVPVINLILNGQLPVKYVSINYIINTANKLEIINTVYAVSIRSDDSLIFIFDKLEMPDDIYPVIDKSYNNYFFINENDTIVKSNYYNNLSSIDNETFMFTTNNISINDDKIKSYICLLDLA